MENNKKSNLTRGAWTVFLIALLVVLCPQLASARPRLVPVQRRSELFRHGQSGDLVRRTTIRNTRLKTSTTVLRYLSGQNRGLRQVETELAGGKVKGLIKRPGTANIKWTAASARPAQYAAFKPGADWKKLATTLTSIKINPSNGVVLKQIKVDNHARGLTSAVTRILRGPATVSGFTNARTTRADGRTVQVIKRPGDGKVTVTRKENGRVTKKTERKGRAFAELPRFAFGELITRGLEKEGGGIRQRKLADWYGVREFKPSNVPHQLMKNIGSYMNWKFKKSRTTEWWARWNATSNDAERCAMLNEGQEPWFNLNHKGRELVTVQGRDLTLTSRAPRYLGKSIEVKGVFREIQSRAIVRKSDLRKLMRTIISEVGLHGGFHDHVAFVPKKAGRLANVWELLNVLVTARSLEQDRSSTPLLYGLVTVPSRRDVENVKSTLDDGAVAGDAGAKFYNIGFRAGIYGKNKKRVGFEIRALGHNPREMTRTEDYLDHMLESGKWRRFASSKSPLQITKESLVERVNQALARGHVINGKRIGASDVMDVAKLIDNAEMPHATGTNHTSFDRRVGLPTAGWEKQSYFTTAERKTITAATDKFVGDVIKLAHDAKQVESKGQSINWKNIGPRLGNAVVGWSAAARITKPMERHLGIDKFGGDYTMGNVNADTATTASFL